MKKQIHSAGKRGFFSKKTIGTQVREKFSFEDMLCFFRRTYPNLLLKISSDLASRAVKMFQVILKDQLRQQYEVWRINCIAYSLCFHWHRKCVSRITRNI